MKNASLNHTYRLVWNEALNAFVAVAEFARGKGKGGQRGTRLLATGLMATGMLSSAWAGGALPTGGNVVAGSGSIQQSGNALTVQQGSDKLVIDWNSFSIGHGNTVNFVQPSASAVALNRVLGSDVSVIQGALNANGMVFLVNPNGVLFTSTAQVNVGGLVASTLNIRNEDFLAGTYRFEGGSSNAIINQGNITAAPGGTIALIAAKITNDGQLTAHQGSVLLGAGSKVTLDMGGPVKLQIENDALETLISNGGVIRADGGTVWLTSQAANNLASSVINNTGRIEANSLGTNQNGEVILFAHGGTLTLGGEVQAKGGFVETSGKHFAIQPGAKVEAAKWLIDPVNITIDSSLASSINTALTSGDVTITTDGACTGVTCSGTGSDGNIDVDADLTWSTNQTLTLSAANNINVNANITHTGTSLGGVIFLYGQGTADGGTSTYAAAGTVTSPSIQWRKGSELWSTRYAIVDGNYFLGGKYVELGICGPDGNHCADGGSGLEGKFGTTNKPSIFFGRASGSGIGMIGDADGFGSGADLRIDYFLPGTPAEQFTAGFLGFGDTTNFASQANSGTFAFQSLGSDGAVRLTYSAVLGGKLEVKQEMSLKLLDAFFNNTVTLTNVDSSSLSDVYFVRSFDPDNTKDLGGAYSNTQKIEQTIAAGGGANVVSATSNSGDNYYTLSGNKTAKIIYFSTDASTQVGYGSAFFSGTSISSMLTAANGLSQGSSQSADQGIGIIYSGGTIAAGASKSFSYLTSLDNRDMATILAELGAAAGATPRPSTPPATTPTAPVIAAVSNVQSLPLEPLSNTASGSLVNSPTTPAPTVVLSQQGNLPVFDISGGLAFVQVNHGATGGAGASSASGSNSGNTAGTAAGTASGSTEGTSASATDGKATSTDSVTGLPTDVGGRDPYGFMRVFVVGGGVNMPASSQGGSSSEAGQSGGTSVATPTSESQDQRRNRPQ